MTLWGCPIFPWPTNPNPALYAADAAACRPLRRRRHRRHPLHRLPRPRPIARPRHCRRCSASTRCSPSSPSTRSLLFLSPFPFSVHSLSRWVHKSSVSRSVRSLGYQSLLLMVVRWLLWHFTEALGYLCDDDFCYIILRQLGICTMIISVILYWGIWAFGYSMLLLMQC
jgi:hypothetical protein